MQLSAVNPFPASFVTASSPGIGRAWLEPSACVCVAARRTAGHPAALPCRPWVLAI